MAILVVVDAKLPEQTMRALAYLGKQFRAEKQVESVYIPGAGPFFDQHGLLYLELDDLQELVAKLTEAQPFIGTLAKDNSLKGLVSIIELALTEGRAMPVDLSFLLDKIRAALRAGPEGKDYQLSWQQMMLAADIAKDGVYAAGQSGTGAAQERPTTRRFILLKPKLDFGTTLPAEQPMKAVRAIVKHAGQLFPGTNIRLTGEVVLEHDELESVQQNTAVASMFAIILVCLSLTAGCRSLKLTLATLIVILMGSILTLGFATLAVCFKFSGHGSPIRPDFSGFINPVPVSRYGDLADTEKSSR